MVGLKYLAAIALLIAVVGSVAGCGSDSNQQTASGNTPSVAVRVATAANRAIPTTIDAVGTITSEFVTGLSSRVQERVESITVSEGDLVRAGETLVMLDTSDLHAAVSQREPYDRVIASIPAPRNSARHRLAACDAVQQIHRFSSTTTVVPVLPVSSQTRSAS